MGPASVTYMHLLLQMLLLHISGLCYVYESPIILPIVRQFIARLLYFQSKIRMNEVFSFLSLFWTFLIFLQSITSPQASTETAAAAGRQVKNPRANKDSRRKADHTIPIYILRKRLIPLLLQKKDTKILMQQCAYLHHMDSLWHT